MIRELASICLALAVGLVATSELGPLPFSYDLYTFRGDDGATTVVASFAVPVRELHRDSKDGQVRYRFDVSFVLTDTALHTVRRTDDSVFVATPRALDGDHLLHTWVELDAASSSDTQQRVIMTDAGTPGVGQMYQSPFVLPDYSGTELMLSDLALGFPDVANGWKRGGASLALLPSSQFPESAFDVYYEIYNLPSDHEYSTEISIESLDGPDDQGTDQTPTVRTVFTGRSGADEEGTIRELRRVESALPRGAYQLTVTVRDEESGGVATQRRRFQVQGWRAGTTLVPALPRRNDLRTGG
ncbi:MAG: hypothetical protein WD995_02120 [Gemmatimonadota bacterium]